MSSPYYESAQADDGTPYIAMEFLEGESLREVLKQRGALPLPEVAEILQQAARGLNAAHKLGIIHRDLKPDNIFLTHGDEGELIVKVVDFGIAKLRESATHTMTGMVLGTPAYMSYEQASGMRSDELDARSDIYSLGVVVYEMLTGRVPFHSDTPVGYLRKHLLEEPPPFRAVAQGLGVPPAVESAVMKALVKDRNQRYGSALEFAHELNSATPPSSPPVTLHATEIAPLSTPPSRPAVQDMLLQARRPIMAQSSPSPSPTGLRGTMARSSAIVAFLREPRYTWWVDLSLLGCIVGTTALLIYPHPEVFGPLELLTNLLTNRETFLGCMWCLIPASALLTTSRYVRQLGNDPTKPRSRLLVLLLFLFAVEVGWLFLRIPGLYDPWPALGFITANFVGFLVTGLRLRCRPLEWAALLIFLLVPILFVAVPGVWTMLPHGMKQGAVKVNPKDELKYVLIPPGTFMMGCSPGDAECDDDEKPPHDVTITKGFWMGQTEVTVGAYKRFAVTKGRQMPPEPNLNGTPLNHGWGDDAMPIVDVTWDDAHAYCSWAGGRLPTEAEWEYAARAGSSGALYEPIESGPKTHEVGQKRANGFGLHDMLGNIGEWVNDWWDQSYYQHSPSQDPTGPASGGGHVLRGASRSDNPRHVGVSARMWVPTGFHLDTNGGFRCGGEVFAPSAHVTSPSSGATVPAGQNPNVEAPVKELGPNEKPPVSAKLSETLQWLKGASEEESGNGTTNITFESNGGDSCAVTITETRAKASPGFWIRESFSPQT